MSQCARRWDIVCEKSKIKEPTSVYKVVDCNFIPGGQERRWQTFVGFIPTSYPARRLLAFLFVERETEAWRGEMTCFKLHSSEGCSTCSEPRSVWLQNCVNCITHHKAASENFHHFRGHQFASFWKMLANIKPMESLHWDTSKIKGWNQRSMWWVQPEIQSCISLALWEWGD